jgi:hypothetical protein
MISSLLYLPATRPDIQFTVGLCARFQASPCSSHRTAVQRIFGYLKHPPEFRIWYSASSLLDLIGFSDADFAGYVIDQKSTSRTCHFLDLLSFAGLLENNLQLPNPPQRLSM